MRAGSVEWGVEREEWGVGLVGVRGRMSVEVRVGVSVKVKQCAALL